MTIGSLPVKISQLKTEFGGPTPSNLTNFYVGAGYVAKHQQNESIPSSGTINLSTFVGAVNVFTSTVTQTAAWLTRSVKNGYATRVYYGAYTGAAGTTSAPAYPPKIQFGGFTNVRVGQSRSSTAQSTLVGIYDTDPGSNSLASYIVFSGDVSTWAWNTITCNGLTVTRSTNTTVTYNSTTASTYWLVANSSISSANGGFFRKKGNFNPDGSVLYFGGTVSPQTIGTGSKQFILSGAYSPSNWVVGDEITVFPFTSPGDITSVAYMSGTYVSYTITGGSGWYFNMNSTNFSTNGGKTTTLTYPYAIKANVGVTTSLSVGIS